MNIDFSRYQGRWHEIAKIPFKWQQNCERSVAIYKFDPITQKLSVENQCWANDQMVYARRATAWVPDPLQNNKLLIKFDDGLPADPVGDYWILWTDYENAIVGSPNHVWWLSRKPYVHAVEVEPMLRKIKSFGYDIDKLMAHPSAVRK